MPRPKRCEFPGAIHMVTLKGYSRGNVFYQPQIFARFPGNPRSHAPDVAHFESLLWETCEQYSGQVHAYFIEPNAARIVIETLGAPLSWIVHDVLARFSMYLIERNRIPNGERPFPRRYKAQTVQPAKLPYVVRHVQRRDMRGAGPRRAINHPFSSNLIYCDRRPPPNSFVVSGMRNTLPPLGYIGSNAYLEFMSARDSPAILHMLSQQIIGDPGFIETIRGHCRSNLRTLSPDDILRGVASTVLHTEPSIACASTHLGALARALVAWYAMRTGTAQIGAVARWFGVSSSDLRYLIHQHRKRKPQYFSKPLPELFPALSERSHPIPPALTAACGSSSPQKAAPSAQMHAQGIKCFLT
jgi:hypothetical protein